LKTMINIENYRSLLKTMIKIENYDRY